jgi:hypothetical protein
MLAWITCREDLACSRRAVSLLALRATSSLCHPLLSVGLPGKDLLEVGMACGVVEVEMWAPPCRSTKAFSSIIAHSQLFNVGVRSCNVGSESEPACRSRKVVRIVLKAGCITSRWSDIPLMVAGASFASAKSRRGNCTLARPALRGQ